MALLTINRLKWYILAALLSLQFTLVFASGTGGFRSEKLIGMNGVADSHKIISNGTLSLFDIILGDSESISVTHMNPNEPAFKLAQLLALVFVAIVIVGGLAVIILGEFGISGIILYALTVLISIAGLEQIQNAIAALIGG